MGSNPINLALRFLLEVTALFAMGMWAWKLSDSWIRFILVIVIPIIAMAIWGTFAVHDDPSRSGQALIQVSGTIRLLIEFAFFGIGFWMIYNMGYSKISFILAIIVVLHYIVSYDRIIWLLSS